MILDLLFPPRCAICDRVVPMGGNHICGNCRTELSYVKEPVCFRCGKEIGSEEEEYCLDCSTKNRSYDKGFPVFNYVPPITDSIMAFKYRGRQEYAAFYAEEIYRLYGENFGKLGIEVIVPVPVHKQKLVSRGYNQAELLAKSLGKLTGIKVRTDLVVRIEDTPPQKELSDEQREKNMRAAFASADRSVSYNSVLLVDDIYTTGATIEACTIVLKELGVEHVYYTSIAIGQV